MMAIMSSLKEVMNVPQSGDVVRRWFSSDELDLIVWYDASGSAQGFHLCYDKGRDEQALVWSANGGLSSASVEDGERDLTRHKASPVLLIHPTMKADVGRVAELFNSACADVPDAIVNLVNAKLLKGLAVSPRLTPRTS
jgi:hypothetical protein